MIFAALRYRCVSFCLSAGWSQCKVKMNSDSEEAQLPEEIGEAVSDGDFERVKAWLAGGSASDPRPINASDHTDWTLLHWTAVSRPPTPEHVEFARYLISRGARVDLQSTDKQYTALHFASKYAGKEMVSVLIAAGAPVNAQTSHSVCKTPLFMIRRVSESTIDVVTTLLRAGASLDSSDSTRFEEHVNRKHDHFDDINASDHHRYIGEIRNLVASVRAAGSWKAHCRLPHKQVLRLRSLVARGRTRERLATTRAIRFIVRQGDNGIVWNILSFWRATD